MVHGENAHDGEGVWLMRGGASKLVILYWDEYGKEKHIIFPGIATETAFVKVLKNYIDKGIKVVIDTEWALKDFGM